MSKSHNDPLEATVGVALEVATSESSIKETIEQILVAFILAFVFRCFIVEAFVIPTGSMAPTLLGAHLDFRCADCGYQWTTNYPDGAGNIPAYASVVDSTRRVVDRVVHARCPNCGFRVPRDLPGDGANDATGPAVQFGDRILVLKYLHLLHEPQRWDVVVFKSPANESNGERFVTNYIKRLVGRPGETIMVLDGDVYVADNDAGKDLANMSREDAAKAFTVQVKPYKIQEAIWRVVYDNDHLPQGLSRNYPRPATVASAREITDSPWRQPWLASNATWTPAGRGFAFDGLDASGELVFDASAMPEKATLTDWLGYDVNFIMRDSPDSFDLDSYKATGAALTPVSDLKLGLTWQRSAGAGPLRMCLTKAGHEFTAEIDDAGARLLMRKPGGTEDKQIASANIGAIGTEPVRIEFINADYRVSLRINGSEVLSSTPADFSPDVLSLLGDYDAQQPQAMPTIRIQAKNQQSKITHVSLWRDGYYLNRSSPRSSPYLWAMPTNFPNGAYGQQLIKLGPDEFFTLGDNSLLSSDARCWDAPIEIPGEKLFAQSGRVPRRFMLGKAFFVYWPAGFRPAGSMPGIVPNFGEMRFIH